MDPIEKLYSKIPNFMITSMCPRILRHWESWESFKCHDYLFSELEVKEQSAAVKQEIDL